MTRLYHLSILASARRASLFAPPWNVIDYPDVLTCFQAGFAWMEAPTTSNTIGTNEDTGEEQAQPKEEDLKNKTVDFLIYPNPVKKTLYIQCNQTSRFSVNIKLMDMFGKEVYQEKGSHLNGKQIDVSEYPEGIYFLSLQWTGGSKLEKIIIQ